MKKNLTICSVLVATATSLSLLSAPVKSRLASAETDYSAAPLPYDSRIEYIKGDGASYITTGIIDAPSYNILEIDFLIDSLSSTEYLCGSLGATYNYLDIQVRSGRPVLMRNLFKSRFPISLGEWHTATYWYDGSLVHYSLDGDSDTYSSTLVRDNLPLSVFAIGTTASNLFKGSVGGVRIRSQATGVLLAELVPVRFTNDQGFDEGALYDTLGGSLFRNQGTGSFIIGPDKED